MKTLTIAFAVATLAAAPFAAFAQNANAASGADAAAVAGALAPANATPASKNWKVGDRVPGAFTASSRYRADVAGLNLPKAPTLHRWIHVADNAYLINEQTDTIVQIAGVPAKA